MDVQMRVDTFDGLRELVAYLRGPDGCPWDREQTHQSIKPYLLEETYEALQAIDEADPQKLQEELGDVLLNILLHAQMAQEAGHFDIGDVIRSVGQKLLRRHPHVFGDLKLGSAQEVLDNWEKLKSHERPEGSSMLESIPKALPALAYARALQERLQQVGLLREPTEELWQRAEQEISTLRGAEPGPEQQERLGRLLFLLSQAARACRLDPEETLRGTNQRLAQRFTHLEDEARRGGIPLPDLATKERLGLS